MALDWTLLSILTLSLWEILSRDIMAKYGEDFYVFGEFLEW